MAENNSEQEKVLVVDDEASIRRILETRLKLAVYNVATAADGQEALEQFNSFQPDLVILDVMLPRMDGYQLIEAIRSQPRCSSLPILVISGDSDPRVRTRVAGLGADAYFPKPYSPAAVRHKLAELLNFENSR